MTQTHDTTDEEQHTTSAPSDTALPWVRIHILDEDGKESMVFPATKIGSITEDAEKAGYDLPTSCRAGACFVCAGRVISGGECVDIGKVSVPLIDIDEDQVLMCVGGIYDHCFQDGGSHDVVIQKQ
jgi:ferredoxin